MDQTIFYLLKTNSPKDTDEIIRLLCKIGENILREPNNLKFRQLSKANETISKKLLPFKGVRECLLFMGFTECTTKFVYPAEHSTVTLNKVIEELRNFGGHKFKADNKELSISPSCSFSQSQNVGKEEFYIKRCILPQVEHKFENKFLRRITEYFHNAMVYENKNLLENARKHIPIFTITENAQFRLRAVQAKIKKGEIEDFDASIKDFVLLELLSWFKTDFFSWVDNPKCKLCKEKTTFSHICSDKELLIYTNRVEMHKCGKCNVFTPFPRYNDLNILLETRRGRCGEWANVFTLLCHAMGFDARIVYDEGDHVWTEVFSPTQNKWVHCDPCENAYDTPLMYESGWKKQITYILAYSPSDIQDVTWRYTSNHKNCLKNRKLCTEKELVDAIITLRNNKIQKFGPAKRQYILKRTLLELAELMVERKPTENDLNGRISGSKDWRLARGEIDEIKIEPFIIKINDNNIVNNKYNFKYSCALDAYKISHINNEIIKEKWNSSIFHQENIIRKHETDWHNVYLCRKEGENNATITWKFLIETTKLKLSEVNLDFKSKSFENGMVNVKVCSENTCHILSNDGSFKSDKFSNDVSISITASLSGGKGNVAWQHTQLFRQSEDSTDYPFQLELLFK